MRRALTACLLLGAAGGLSVLPSRAQDGGTAAGPVVGFVAFGLEHPEVGVAFQFDDLVYGVSLNRRGLSAALTTGTSSTPGRSGPDELDLFDLSLAVSGTAFGELTASLPISIPILLHSTYRRVRRAQGDVDFAVFEYTGLGLGVGLAAQASRGEWVLDLRGVPGIGIASRSFGNSTGSTLLVDGDVQLTGPRVFGRFGLSLGYNYRWQSWRVGGPDAFDVAGGGKFTYDGASHTLRAGVNW